MNRATQQGRLMQKIMSAENGKRMSAKRIIEPLGCISASLIRQYET